MLLWKILRVYLLSPWLSMLFLLKLVELIWYFLLTVLCYDRVTLLFIEIDIVFAATILKKKKKRRKKRKEARRLLDHAFLQLRFCNQWSTLWSWDRGCSIFYFFKRKRWEQLFKSFSFETDDKSPFNGSVQTSRENQ